MREQLEEIRSRALAELGDGATEAQIENVRVRVLGRAGELTEIMRRMREVPNEERPAIGRLINELKSEVESRIAALSETLKHAEMERLARRGAPGRDAARDAHPARMAPSGHAHAASGCSTSSARWASRWSKRRTSRTTSTISARLNFPADHPAREMQDTFFLPGGMLLRTHTSNGQIRVMERRRPPLAIVCPGNCYRRDELSVRASPMFSQIEGFMVDRAGVITMGALERRADRIPARILRTRHRRAISLELLSVHRTERRSRYQLPALSRRRMPRVQAERMDRNSRLRHDPSERAARGRLRPGGILRGSPSAWASSALRCSSSGWMTCACSSRTTCAFSASSESASEAAS